MTLPRLDALMGYYEDHPPVHLMVAAYLGIRSKARPRADGARPVPPPAHPAGQGQTAEPSFFEILTSLQHG